MKVFHGIVNYGTQAGLLAKGLRDEGIEALSVSAPDRFKRKIDIELLQGNRYSFRGIRILIWNLLRSFYWFCKFDIFHFYYGTSLLPNQLDLPLYKFFGKKVVMEYLGSDVQGYEFSVKKYKYRNCYIVISKRYEFLLPEMNDKINGLNTKLYKEILQVRNKDTEVIWESGNKFRIISKKTLEGISKK